MKKKVSVIGSSNVDLIMKMDRLPKVGETITDASFVQVYGGKGANQAVAAARASGDVLFVNCVGDDAYTPQMVQDFQNDGMDTQFVFQEEGMPSGHALVMIGPEGNNYLSVAPGANYELTPAYIDKAWGAIEDSAVIVMQNEIPADTNAYVLEKAKASGIPVFWNFAPAKESPKELYPKVEILIVNETEAEFICGFDVNSQETAEKAIAELNKLGSKLVIVTLGAKGVVFGDAKDTQFVPAFRVVAEDTTAAGDVFCGCFAVSYAEGKSLEDSIRFACAASALSVQKLGAQPSIPQRADIDQFLKDNS